MQNIVILAGNIGQEPETVTTQGNTSITRFTLATSRPRYAEGKVLRDKDGVDRYGCEIIAETVDFLNRGKPAQENGAEDTDIPF